MEVAISKYVLSAKKFEFDEREARRARHRKQVAEAMLRRKMAKRTMRRIVESVKRTSEEQKELQVQNFIAEVQYYPNRKRLPTPPDIYSPSYDALLYLKGIPYTATEKMVFEWLKNYEVVNVVFIKNQNGFFTGDAYVRCENIEVRDKASREMANRMIGGRYIQVFRVNENAYLEYYHAGCRKEPKERNYIDPSVLVITNNQYRKLLDPDSKGGEGASGPQVSFVNNINKSLDISDVKTGLRLVGTVTEIYRNGVIVECNISETRDGVKEKVFCILKKNRIAKNIGMQGQQHEWLRMKQLILYPGIRLNLYVEKVRETTAQNTFDEDMWKEHFEESLIETYFDMDANEEKQKETKRPLVYLTMDSSVSEDKVLWWEKKILNEVLSRHQTRNYEDIVLKEDIKETIKADRMLTNKVKVEELHQGNTVVYGNKPNQIMLSKDDRGLNDSHGTKQYDSQEDKSNRLEESLVNDISSNEVQLYPYNNRSIERSGQAVDVRGKYMGEDYGHGSETELPDDVPIGSLLKHTRADNDKVFLLEAGDSNGEKENEKGDKIEFIDLNYKKLVKRFFKNTTIYDNDIQFHDFDTEIEDVEEKDDLEESEEALEDYNWTLEPEARLDLNSFPKLSLTDGAIKIPPNGLILRESEVNKMKNEQVKGVLELLGKETKESYDENKEYLVEVIRKEGVPNESLPQALIQRGLQKVKRSKKYMKNIVNLTKDLTERKFSQEDLDAATTEELEMLVEEGLYKFLNWNPPFDIKKQFITNYHHLLEDNVNLPTIAEVVPKPGFIKSTEESESNEESRLADGSDEYTKTVEKMWNDMKWLIVIFIYGDQGDLKEIVEQLERTRNTEGARKKLESLIIEAKED
nr:hypothetical protein MACL_00000066 [Theileria orientalis]